MRRILFFCVILALLLSTPFTAIPSAAVGEYCWFCERSGQKQPRISQEEKLINKYNAYNIDRSVSDTSDNRVIYLTFDVGYENGNTAKILDVLREEDVKAAFFILDNVIYRNKDLLMRMVEEGHSVCNHTLNHKNICRMTSNDAKANVLSLEKLYNQQTGLEMSKYFRFPEGKYSEEALKAVNELGYKTFFWSFAYADWDNSSQPNTEYAYKKVIDNTHNGAIMLFHPTSSTNVQIFPRLISEWKAMGYTFGTLDQVGL